MFFRRTQARALICCMPLSLVSIGCGTNFEEILLQAASALGRTALDLSITELANDLANGSTNEPDDQDSDIDDADDMATDEPDLGDSPGDDGSSDVARGETLVTDNCSACHGADGASGFAPSIQGASADEIASKIGGADGHLVVSLSDQDAEDMAAFLGSFEGSGDAVEGDSDEGESAFIAFGCAGCHCADASGGCALDAPNLVGASFQELTDVVVGNVPHAGGITDLSDEEIADIQAYLDSL